MRILALAVAVLQFNLVIVRACTYESSSYQNEFGNLTITYDTCSLQLDAIFTLKSTNFKGTSLFYLYSASPRTGSEAECQWIKIHRREMAIETKNFKQSTIFEKIYSGAYCLAIYGEDTSRPPVFNSEEPFHLITDVVELDIELWNPDLEIQQYERNSLLIDPGLNESDGYGFDEFVIELFRYELAAADCNTISSKSEYIVDFRIPIMENVLVSNMSDGFYCFRITPIDPRCVFSHSVMTLPCSRVSRVISLIADTPVDVESEPWIPAVCILASIFLLAVFVIGSYWFSLVRRRQRKQSRKDPAKSFSIVLVHSNREQCARPFVLHLKMILSKHLDCQFEDYADDEEEETVAMDGFSWFLSRFDRPGNFIIVVECGDSSSSSANILTNDQQQKIPLLYSMAVENLKMLASTSKSRRILLIRYECPLGHQDVLKATPTAVDPFSTFNLPIDFNNLINYMNHTSSEGIGLD